jgi:hypothetical protein
MIHTQFVLGLEGHPWIQSGRRGVSDTGFTGKGLLGNRRKRGLGDEGGIVGGGERRRGWIGGVGGQEVKVRDVNGGVGAVGGDGVVEEVVDGVLNDPELPAVPSVIGSVVDHVRGKQGLHDFLSGKRWMFVAEPGDDTMY